LSCYFSRKETKLEVDRVQENSNNGVEGRAKGSSNDASKVGRAAGANIILNPAFKGTEFDITVDGVGRFTGVYFLG